METLRVILTINPQPTATVTVDMTKEDYDKLQFQLAHDEEIDLFDLNVDFSDVLNNMEITVEEADLASS